MYAVIDYFLKNSRLNYTLVAFLVVLGVLSYNSIPKELFPSVELNQVKVSGSYSGASAASLNGFAVTDIENEIKSVAGIEKLNTTIRSGVFTIKADIKDNATPIKVLNEIKDALSQTISNLPADMKEPTANLVARNSTLFTLSIGAKDEATLLQKAKLLESRLYQYEHINEVVIYGDTDLQIDIKLDTEKLAAYNLSASSLSNAIAKLSYIYPVGEIEEKGHHLYLNTQDNKLNVDFWKEQLLSIDSKKIYLADIADVVIHYPSNETISRVDGQKSITLRVFKSEEGNAIAMAKDLRKVLSAFEKEQDVAIDYLRDASKPIKDRLDTVISNISFGLVLVALSMYFLISPRISLVVVMGIPFSFIIGIVLLDMYGMSLNMVSLLACLITLGIVVDDAVVVAENIQRYLDEGLAMKEAVTRGTKEMLMPVFIAASTTIFAFLPMMYLSGRLGTFLVMIPVVVTILILASLIESFLFLPLHGKHLLKAKEKMLDWSPIYDFYESLLHRVIAYKKVFLALFFIIVPLLTILSIQASKFQFFPRLDGDDITFSVRFNESVSLEDASEIAKEFEQVLIAKKKELFADNVELIVGSFQDISYNRENMENSFSITLNLQDYKEDNFIQNYLNPIFTFSFNFEQASKQRILKSHQIIKKLRKIITPLVKKHKATDFNITARRIGIVKTDLEVKLAAKDKTHIIKALALLHQELANIEGVIDVSDNAQLGKDEYRFSLNDYAKSLGLNEQDIASTLSAYFLEKDQGDALSTEGIVNIKTQALQKDELQAVENFNLPLSDGTFVRLAEVVDFEISKDFNKIEKENGEILKAVYANVVYEIITPSEVLEKLQKSFNEIESMGVKVSFGGEQEQNKQLQSELSRAALISVFLIFLALLINFPRFSQAFMILSVIPFTVLGAVVGHFIMGINLTMPSLIGILGLAGVVINDGIIMLDFLKQTTTQEAFFKKAKQRVRPILITSITTLLGLSTLIFYPSGQGVILQPLAISLGFGLLWGTVLNLVYLPTLYALIYKIKG